MVIRVSVPFSTAETGKIDKHTKTAQEQKTKEKEGSIGILPLSLSVVCIDHTLDIITGGISILAKVHHPITPALPAIQE